MQAQLLRLLVLLSVIESGVPYAAAADASFLDQPVAPDLLLEPNKDQGQQTCVLRLEKLRGAAGKPIHLPEGVENFVKKKDKEEDWGKGKVLFLNEGSWEAFPEKPRLRDFLDRGFSNLGLSWKYDSSQDAIVSDFAWRRDDSRDGAELMNILSSSHPRPFEFGNKVADPWQEAFDALLSKPENLERAWPVRFCAAQRTFFATNRTTNMVAGKMWDDAGQQHYMIVNSQPEFCNPGPEGSFSYYLFDLQGKLEEGGLETIGYRCFNDSAWLESDGTHLDVRTWNNGRVRRDIRFVVSNGHLIRKESLVDGVVPTGWRLKDLDSGERLYTSGE